VIIIMAASAQPSTPNAIRSNGDNQAINALNSHINSLKASQGRWSSWNLGFLVAAAVLTALALAAQHVASLKSTELSIAQEDLATAKEQHGLVPYFETNG
jgi:hypothetical protein